MISRHSTIAPIREPDFSSGIARIDNVTLADSRSARQGAFPVSTRGRDSSTVDCFLTTLVATSARDLPSNSPSMPNRLNPEIPLGLANNTVPSISSLSNPSLALGAPLLFPVGEERSGKVPSEIISSKSLPQLR